MSGSIAMAVNGVWGWAVRTLVVGVCERQCLSSVLWACLSLDMPGIVDPVAAAAVSSRRASSSRPVADDVTGIDGARRSADLTPSSAILF
uniref:Secreted protein n=1 Tax=Oryza meridionalis TaxID=40149 RepID=A0A0E0BZT7_9ORYZ